MRKQTPFKWLWRQLDREGKFVLILTSVLGLGLMIGVAVIMTLLCMRSARELASGADPQIMLSMIGIVGAQVAMAVALGMGTIAQGEIHAVLRVMMKRLSQDEGQPNQQPDDGGKPEASRS